MTTIKRLATDLTNSASKLLIIINRITNDPDLSTYNLISATIDIDNYVDLIFTGIINSSFEHQKILGFPALKGDFLQKDIAKFAKNNNWQLFHNYYCSLKNNK